MNAYPPPPPSSTKKYEAYSRKQERQTDSGARDDQTGHICATSAALRDCEEGEGTGGTFCGVNTQQRLKDKDANENG